MTALFGALTGWLHFSALVLALGAVVGRWRLVPGDADAEQRRSLLATAAGMARVGVACLAAAMVMIFVRQLVEFRDPFAPLSEDVRLLTGTAWGGSWRWASAGTLAALLCFALLRPEGKLGWLVGSGLLVALAAFPAFTGHASGTGDLRPLSLTADTVHVVAAGSWVGGLAFVLLGDRRWRATGGGDGLIGRLVRAFSPVALVSVALLVVTGTLAAFLQIEGFAALFSTAYGRLLVLKLALVAGVLALGARNWKVLTPRLGTGDGVRSLRSSALLELTIAQVVLLVTAVLVRTSPLAH